MIQAENMSDQQEIVYIDKKSFSCDGGLMNNWTDNPLEAGHPKVFFTMNKNGFAICNYCNIKYVYRKEEE